MQVSSVNNLIFNGKFQKSPAIKEILEYAEKKSLTKFDTIIDKASTYKDNALFNFTRSRKVVNRAGDLEFQYYFDLMQKNTKTQKEEGILEVIYTDSFYSTPEGKKRIKAMILEEFNKVLEKIYPVESSNAEKVSSTKEEIIKNILNKLA